MRARAAIGVLRQVLNAAAADWDLSVADLEEIDAIAPLGPPPA